ncbi:MAG: phosphoribosylanthranilate isomerase [Rubellimicrobium sp.]|nr:phosphoribosylanthranilate isomerase [Rubellimicrobium sp.]
MPVLVKICGLSDRAGIAAAAQAGARYAGFVFFPKSPRAVSVATARDLAAQVPFGIAKVALVVDADDALIDAITGAVGIDMLQLHGAESPERVADIRARTGLPVMKAMGIAGRDDMERLAPYFTVADQILVDARPPAGAQLPGGNGIAFDWRLVAGRRWPRPWMLAGGLTPDNVAEAIRLTGARQVDVSTGVESAPGQKDPDRIARFTAAAHAAADPAADPA